MRFRRFRLFHCRWDGLCLVGGRGSHRVVAPRGSPTDSVVAAPAKSDLRPRCVGAFSGEYGAKEVMTGNDETVKREIDGVQHGMRPSGPGEGLASPFVKRSQFLLKS